MKFLLNYQKRISIILLYLCTWTIIYGQETEEPLPILDRQRLIELYEDTDGDNWLNNTNWLSENINTWYGVEVENGRVVRLDLSGNNLRGSIPSDIIALEQLEYFDCSKNKITDLPDMSGMQNITYFDCSLNFLDFDDLVGNYDIEYIDYTPQLPFGSGLDTIVCVDSTLLLPINITGQNTYQWTKDNVVIENETDGYQILNDGSLLIETIEDHHGGKYVCKVENELIPDLILTSAPFNIKLCKLDSLGGPYLSNQLVVQFYPSTSTSDRDYLLDLFGSDRLDENPCADLELWLIPDTIIYAGTDTLISIEEIKDEIRQNPGVQEVDLNHLFELDAVEKIDFVYPKLNQNTNDDDEGEVKVAIIDTGIDTDHYELVGDIWLNELEVLDEEDNDGNCAIDDIYGVNFVDPQRPLFDDHSHGTHVAGIIQTNALITPKLLALKTHDKNGVGDIFRMTAAIYYARDEQAQVVNMSTGYYGQANQILRKAIEEMQAHNMIFVTSAGNSGLDVDLIAHYPSGYDLDNIIAVGAIDDIDNGELSSYSNYGKNMVDIIAEGTLISSTIPDNDFGIKTGTSMSAAAVSGIVADAIAKYPDACYLQIIDCLYKSGRYEPSLEEYTRTGRVLKVGDYQICCEAPNNLNSQVISANVVSLSWEGIDCNQNYQLAYREVGTLDWALIAVNDTRKYLNNLKPGTKYEWKVGLVCINDGVEWAAVKLFRTGLELCDYPYLNNIVIAIGISGNDMMANIDWSMAAVTTNIYQIEYKETGGDWAILTLDVPHLTIGVSSGSTYLYRIKSQCIDGWTNWSPIYQFSVGGFAAREIKDTEEEPSVMIVPNPVSDQLMIKMEGKEKPEYIDIRSFSGQLIERILVKNQSQIRWNAELLPLGMYYLIFSFENKERITEKLIKIPK